MLSLLLLASTVAQVAVQWSPVPLAVTRAKYGPVREVGEWTVRACNDGAEPVQIHATRLYMLADEVSAISPESAIILLAARGDDRLMARLARLLDAGSDIGAVALAGYSSPGAGLALVLAKKLATRAKERAPALDLSAVLSGWVPLEPGGCAERVAFAPLRKRERLRSYSYTLAALGRRAAVAGITSIPK